MIDHKILHLTHFRIMDAFGWSKLINKYYVHVVRIQVQITHGNRGLSSVTGAVAAMTAISPHLGSSFELTGLH